MRSLKRVLLIPVCALLLALVMPALAAADNVVADDQIVQGSECVGLDCVDNEAFGFDTLRLKENNTQLAFDDTSTGAGFPNNDWALVANDTTSGGLNRFMVKDVTGSTTPVSVLAGAPDNSLYIDPTGKVGLGTSTPGLDLSLKSGDTPAVRLEQDTSLGFGAQTWDVGANEANFFVRDATGGSRLPFRIRPGAPTSSVDISATGKVGMGTSSPSQQLDVVGNALAEQAVLQGADPANVTGSAPVDGAATLVALRALPLTTGQYTSDGAHLTHILPLAHAFNAAFGLGADDGTISPGDMAGVALAAVKQLDSQVTALTLAKGDTGATGAAGAKGDTGAAGAAGSTGAPGAAGASVSNAAILKRLTALEKANRSLTARVKKLEKKLAPKKKAKKM